PGHRLDPGAHHRLRREIEEDGAEERERDADAAEDEVFPRCLDRLVRAIEADHEDGGERRALDRNPHDAEIVRDQRQQHGEDEGLVHRVVGAQPRRGEAPGLDLVVDIAGAEEAGREGDEARQHDEIDVEVVDEEEHSAAARHAEEDEACKKGQERAGDVDPRGEAVPGDEDEDERRQQRQAEHRLQRVDRQGSAHRCSPRKVSMYCRSSVSKRSRMWKKKMPKMMNATITEKAMLISTTSGMPLTPTAARKSPFSSEMKPTTWVTALRRVIMTRRPTRTTESAIARLSRVSAPDPAVTGSTRRIERATSATPAIIVGPMPITVSIVWWMPRWVTMRRK